MRPILVAGAGAAGLMSAIAAARAGRSVVVIDGTPDGGRKILISGGGRCNVLPRVIQPERFVTDSPAHLVRRWLRSWRIDEQRAFFEHDAGVPLALEESSGKYFPASNRARDVRDGLVSLARRHGVDFRFGTRLADLARRGDQWVAATTDGPIEAAAVVLATGGRSVPATGSDGFGLEIAGRLGHRIHDTYPALTPLAAVPPVHAGLAGVSIDVRIRATWGRQHAEAHGGFLFTHRGYSGPAVLDVSHVAVRSAAHGTDRAAVRVRWTERDAPAWHAELRNAPGLVLTSVARHVPDRLAEMLLHEAGVPGDRRAADLRRVERTALVERLTAFALPWTGDEGYAKAEVTGGGIALDEVDARTLESRRQPGLFLCGEILDAFGPIGGHNFAWAWTTGRLAGLGAAARALS